MPTSSSFAAIEKKKSFRLQAPQARADRSHEETFLTIESLPSRKLSKRSHSTLNASQIKSIDLISLETKPDGSVHISRPENENTDRLSLDRRGLSNFPVINEENKLRLLSLQHNLITNLDGLKNQNFPWLVFLDIYDNQLERLAGLDKLENLRVLLLGKNRLKKIDGLANLNKIEVLDLHGNQISQVTGLNMLTDLKVLNLAGNQIRTIGLSDFEGLKALQELNLRRNRLRKLLGFAETPTLSKLFLSNNEIHSVEDISSLAKSTTIKEITIDNNPIFLSGDCVSFLVSYLPQLNKLNAMLITEQVRKAAMAWRRNKESTNASFMDLTSDVCLNVRREEIISNARTNWELLRSQTKCLNHKKGSTKKITPNVNQLSFDSDLIGTSLTPARPKTVTTKGTLRKLKRTASQDSQNTSSSNTSSNEYIRLPPILVPIIKKLEQKSDASKENSVKLSNSLSSIGPNFDSSVCSLATENDSDSDTSSSDTQSAVVPEKDEPILKMNDEIAEVKVEAVVVEPIQVIKNCNEKCLKTEKVARNVKSATNSKLPSTKPLKRATTVKVKKQSPPLPPAIKDREQGGDYLVEICGRFLNVYGQCALRFIDKPWNTSKANDVTTVKFNYVNYNGISGILNRLKVRFPNIENYHFKETNISCLGQLNAIAEVQGLSNLVIDSEGNPICDKEWRNYAIFRLSHWGLKSINNQEITEDAIRLANEEYQGLSDLVLLTLPDSLLQPLLARLRLDVNCCDEKNAKKWLMEADPELRSVVCKEALQWKKNGDDPVLRQKAFQHISSLLDELNHSVNKLSLLETMWPSVLHEFVKNTLLDYSQLDMYMKQKLSELK